ncbi:MAG: hypothetical protein IJ111_12555 [Eggerthellaceae bacterium]|nr:hypothetical protein [Eggerthellaceae bacterium]
MLSSLETYDAIYALAAEGELQAALFGDCQTLAREAFRRSSLAGGAFPIVWFELPLFGNPRFDLHVAHGRGTIEGNPTFATGAGNGYDELLAWYSREERGGRGLAFSYDVSDGRIDDPSIIVNVNGEPLDDMAHFFELIADATAARAYQGFADCLPQGWRVWYAGVCPGRPGSPVRVDCFVDEDLKGAYVRDIALFERDLRSVGFSALGPTLRDLARPVLESPFGLELQFDVSRDGATGATLGLSAGFSLMSPARARLLFGQGGAAARLFGRVEQMGLADGRWRRLPDACFATGVPLEEGLASLYCVPAFLKLRMRDGVPLDAKAYLQAGASVAR